MSIVLKRICPFYCLFEVDSHWVPLKLVPQGIICFLRQQMQDSSSKRFVSLLKTVDARLKPDIRPADEADNACTCCKATHTRGVHNAIKAYKDVLPKWVTFSHKKIPRHRSH